MHLVRPCQCHPLQSGYKQLHSKDDDRYDSIRDERKVCKRLSWVFLTVVYHPSFASILVFLCVVLTTVGLELCFMYHFVIFELQYKSST